MACGFLSETDIGAGDDDGFSCAVYLRDLWCDEELGIEEACEMLLVDVYSSYALVRTLSWQKRHCANVDVM